MQVFWGNHMAVSSCVMLLTQNIILRIDFLVFSIWLESPPGHMALEASFIPLSNEKYNLLLTKK